MKDFFADILDSLLGPKMEGIDKGLLGKQLGKGQQGKVLAYGEKRVVKVVTHSGKGYERSVELYERLREVNHKNVVKIYGWGEMRKGWWVEMERLEPIKCSLKRRCLEYESAESVNPMTGEMEYDGEIEAFLDEISILKKMGLEYFDLHADNVMLGGRKKKELKICDVDGFRIMN